MGRQANRKTARRSLGERLNAARGDPEAMAALSLDPEMQALAASFWDEECAALRDRDRRAQMARLTRGGWVRREENHDGLGTWDQPGVRPRRRVIHSLCREQDGHVWGHVSVSQQSGVMPSWEQARDAGWLFYPDLFGIIVVAPQAAHVSLKEVAHVWYKLTGAPGCPDFSHGLGTI